MEGGGVAMFNDPYPDGWNIDAKRLSDKRYDPKGKVIHFYQSGCFDTTVDKEIKVLRKMQMTFI